MSNGLLIVAVISRDRVVHDGIAAALEGHPEVDSLWVLPDYPEPQQLAEIHKAEHGCIVFLDFTDSIRASAIAAEIDRAYPNAGVAAVRFGQHPQDLVEMMQLGIRDVLAVPLAAPDVTRAFSRLSRRLKPSADNFDTGGDLFAFLPAKPGAGATTLATNAAAAAARLSRDRVLLLDFDFRLGMTSFLFKLHGDHSILDALRSNSQMDATLWDSLVSRRGTLDILGSAPTEFSGVDPERGTRSVLEFARRTYPTICVDLPGEMRDYELETICSAKECFLVCTPDIGSLHMAKRKADLLRSLDLSSKVSVIMNRSDSRGSISAAEVEAILQLPVRFSVVSAEKQVMDATQKGRPLEGRTTIITQIEAVARRMAPLAVRPAAPLARKFIEFFSVTPVRDRGAWGSQK